MVVLLSGQIKNIGDFLITERARLLFKELVDEEIVILDRTKDLTPQLDIINSSKIVVLCGGPAYAPDIYGGIYPLVKDLSLIKVPIIPFGLGWCGRPVGKPLDFKFTEESQGLLNNVHEQIAFSSCRCNDTKSVLENNGYTNVKMTGCPVWYDLPSLGKSFKKPKEVKKIVFTTAADPKLIGQTVSLIRVLKNNFPNAEITMTYHRGILPDAHTTIRATIGYLAMALGAKLVKWNVKIKDVAYDLRKLDFYDDCDFHLGYRVHAHLYFLSKRLPSILINEDGRGEGMVKTMNLPVLNIKDEALVKKVDQTIKSYKQENFDQMDEVQKYIDANFSVMKEFLESL